MLKISQTPAFIRDYKSLIKKHFNKQLLKEAVSCLAAQDKETLARKYRDHALSGNWKGFRELHVEKNPYREFPKHLSYAKEIYEIIDSSV